MLASPALIIQGLAGSIPLVKRATTLSLAFLLSLPAISFADPGNVVSWFSNSQNELTFTCATAVVKLNLMDANVARVRLEPGGVPFNTNASFTVIKNWVLPPITVIDGSTLTVTTSGLRVDVSKTPFHLTFRKTDGTVWLTGILTRPKPPSPPAVRSPT